jgi:uncharacterized protein YciI
MQQMTEFMYMFRPKRENFLQTMTPEEMTAFGGHAEYTKKLFAEGKVILMGACTDGACGTVIFKAASVEDAQLIFDNDPAVMAGIVYAELHPYKVVAFKYP